MGHHTALILSVDIGHLFVDQRAGVQTWQYGLGLFVEAGGLCGGWVCNYLHSAYHTHRLVSPIGAAFIGGQRRLEWRRS